MRHLFFRLTTCLFVPCGKFGSPYLGKQSSRKSSTPHSRADNNCCARSIRIHKNSSAAVSVVSLSITRSTVATGSALFYANLCNASDLFLTAPVCQLRVCSCAVWKGFAIGCVCVCVPLCTVYMFMRVQCSVSYVYACMCVCLRAMFIMFM